MLSNAYFLAKIGADTAGSEQHFAEFWPKISAARLGPRPPGPDPREEPGRSVRGGGGSGQL